MQTFITLVNESELDSYPNTDTPTPKHIEKGPYREFHNKSSVDFILNGVSTVAFQYSSSTRQGCDIYCAHCNHWNTVKGTSILFELTGKCKVCGTHWNTPDIKQNIQQL